MSRKYLIRITELERLLSEQAEALRQKDQQLSLVEETEAFLRSALARAEEKIEEDEREIEHLRAQIQQQMKTLSRHSDTAKAFAYLLKQWDALNVYCSNGWVEIDNNIAENALRGVAVGRKNWMFAGSDSGGEHAAVLYSLIGTCRLNNVEPEKWLRYVIEHIQDWPANRVRDLLPWKVDLSSQ